MLCCAVLQPLHSAAGTGCRYVVTTMQADWLVSVPAAPPVYVSTVQYSGQNSSQRDAAYLQRH